MRAGEVVKGDDGFPLSCGTGFQQRISRRGAENAEISPRERKSLGFVEDRKIPGRGWLPGHGSHSRVGCH